jgi:hypothetical protein
MPRWSRRASRGEHGGARSDQAGIHGAADPGRRAARNRRGLPRGAGRRQSDATMAKAARIGRRGLSVCEREKPRASRSGRRSCNAGRPAAAAAGPKLRPRMTPLERCLGCDSPEAIEIRHQNGAQAFEGNCNLSPNLTPIGCCRIKIVNVTWSGENGAAAAATPAVEVRRSCGPMRRRRLPAASWRNDPRG